MHSPELLSIKEASRRALRNKAHSGRERNNAESVDWYISRLSNSPPPASRVAKSINKGRKVRAQQGSASTRHAQVASASHRISKAGRPRKVATASKPKQRSGGSLRR